MISARYILLLTVLLTVVMAETPVRQLAVDSRSSIRNQKASVLLAPALDCDDHQNVYIGSLDGQLIQRVSRDGQNVFGYSLPPLFDKEHTVGLADLHVGNDGTLYILAVRMRPLAKMPGIPTPESIPKGHVLRFDKDGTRMSDVALNLQGFVTGTFAVTA